MLSSTWFNVRWYNDSNKPIDFFNERPSGSVKSNGYRSTYLNSSLNKKQQSEIENKLITGDIQFLYVAPERFESNYF